ncbi:MAG: hypothetical protein EAY75_09595 [Bacteroidetes bacterium]|nr:MAG: hypothetical protein EAY75_09595 [Bacteroidota bacterium]
MLVATLMLLLLACQRGPQSVVRGFYFWKTQVTLGPTESQAFEALRCKLLYIKCFDVVWNQAAQQPEPVALAHFGNNLPRQAQLVPVVFITNETLQWLSPASIDSLAGNINRLLTSLWQENELPATAEVQIDCDWTAGTKNNYFQLLLALQKLPFFKGKNTSATIRLHQIKYAAQTGVPPVKKGLLMCYNMGNLQQPQTKNSIVDVETMAQYTGNLNQYPLPLDLALPIFDWWVWYRGNHYQGLLHTHALPTPYSRSQKTMFNADTTINDFTFKAGDWLRYETATPAALQAVSQHLMQKLPPGSNRQVVLYHLDAKNLARYETNTLEAIFNRFGR